MTEKPNILWICTDQQRYDTIGALGNPLARTPHIDRLIGGGVAFERAYCQSPVCTPSRASFLTGRYPRTTRCRQNGQSIPGDEVLVSKMFSDAGYRCGLAGKLHLASCSDGKVEERIEDGYHDFYWSHHPQPDWPENAYTRWLEEKGKTWDELYGGKGDGGGYVLGGVPAEYHQTTWCAEKTVEFIRENNGRPWFFSFNCFDPHHPFDPPPEYLEKYDTNAMPLPKTRPGEGNNKPHFQELDREWAHNSPGEFHTGAMTDQDRRKVCAAYYAMCELIDDQVGRMLEALEETGQAENTVVIFMSDHGEMLGDHGIYFKGPHFYEGVERVPLVMRWPEGFAEGRRVTGLVELVDLVPTLLEAAGMEIPERVQGKSLMGMLERREGNLERGISVAGRPRLLGEEGRDFVFSEYYNSWTHGDAYGTMLRTRDTKVVVYHGTGEGELYDLNNDPDEFSNLWDSEHHRALRMEMVERCFDASVFTMDPHPPRRGPF